MKIDELGQHVIGGKPPGEQADPSGSLAVSCLIANEGYAPVAKRIEILAIDDFDTVTGWDSVYESAGSQNDRGQT